MSQTNDVIQTQDITRPDKALCDALAKIGTATCTGQLCRMGVTNPYMLGPVCWTKGKSLAGPALTLQFMPKREDLYPEGEYTAPEKQLHRHVLYHTQPGDMVVVDARGDMTSGIFGEMMLTYFQGKGGQGVIIDGCVRDWPNIQKLKLGVWVRGVTPNFHTQTKIFPFAVNVPIACGDVLVMPGDIVVADEDGVVVVPVALAPELVKRASEHHEWEDFSRERLEAGGDLRRYYPLMDAARPEYEEWKKKHGRS